MKETYPVPGKRPHLTLVPTGEYGNTLDEFEEKIFREADHFNVVRFGTHNGSEIKTVKSFAEAVYIASNDPRILIYAVALSGRAFCLARKDFGKFAEIWLEMHPSMGEVYD